MDTAFTLPLNAAAMYRGWFDTCGGLEIWSRGIHEVFVAPVKKDALFLVVVGGGAQLNRTITDPSEIAVAAAGQIIGRLSDHTAAEWTAKAMAQQAATNRAIERIADHLNKVLGGVDVEA
jgi:hypothetical protein